VASVAADYVGVAEVGVGVEHGGGDFFFIGEQVVGAIYFPTVVRGRTVGSGKLL